MKKKLFSVLKYSAMITLVLTTLKLTGTITASWLWVTVLIWMWPATYALVIVLMAIWLLYAWIYDAIEGLFKNKKK